MLLDLTRRRRVVGLLVVVVVAMAVLTVRSAAGITINVSGGNSFNRDILGQSPTLGLGDDYAKAWEVCNGSIARGVAQGLDADTYNWQDESHKTPYPTDPTTLGWLRDARDHNSQPLLTANIRGIGTGDYDNFQYTDMSTSTLATLAANWVNYTNNIVQNYRQGQPRPPAVAVSLNQLSWGGEDKLLAFGEAAVPKVTRWEIGNEPECPGQPGTTYYYISPEDYVPRYKAISAAMLAQDPTIKVGACSSGATSQLAAVLADPTAKVDFISYHPYGNQVLTSAAGLRNLKGMNTTYYNNEVAALATNGRPTSTPIIASEWNPQAMVGHVETEPQFNSMAQALAVAETVFTFAELGLEGANFWPRPANFGKEMPAYKVFQALENHIGDKLVYSWSGGLPAQLSNTRLYVTKDTETQEVVLWGLNFSNSADTTVNVDLSNLGFPTTSGTLMSLGWTSDTVATYGPTALTNPYGVFDIDPPYIDWTSSLLTDLNTSNLTLSLPHSTVTALILSVPEPSSLVLSTIAVLGGLAYAWRRRK